ncbi:RtcB family protein [Brevibacillus parabrevis]|uniref:RtcB family protein n=1 Tax=Brevibacillus parabrevis TaxID=54914 RepID=UPI002E1D620B|nr:RtcB family protein [Brevibacillus parabrevis]
MKTINHGQHHREVQLGSGSVHVFANDEVFASFGERVYEMAEHNLRIPRNVYFSYTPDAHVGIGTCIGTTAVWNMHDGFVSPSIVGSDIGCGMRVHMTPLHRDDLQDKNLKRKLIEAIEAYVPTSERGQTDFTDISIEEVVKHGLNGLPAAYLATPTGEPGEVSRSLTHVEKHAFAFDHAALAHIPAKSWQRAWGQLGTLGGGNHFIEIQAIEIAEENREIATEWGLFDGQVVIMIHSGSRAWGATLGRDYTKSFKEAMFKWGIENPEPNLVYAPIETAEGQRYLNLMYSALNYAVTNRHLIGYSVERAFQDVLGKDFSTPVLYDLMHNYALQEYHRNTPMLIHRKGATKALPAGHFQNPKAYKKTGHPALIPGSMGTSSYIMVGADSGAKNFYSICHGAGRVRSRKATKEIVTIDQFERALRVGEDDEIMVNHRSLAAILDECPQAYKDVDQIIDSVVGAKLASVVAKCKPLIAIKGV